MRILFIGILTLLMLSFSRPPWGDGRACGAHEGIARLQEHPPSAEAGRCCHDGGNEEAPGDHCPPACHCACCHSPAVFPLVKRHLPSFRPETSRPGIIFRYYSFDFHHFIWHPPQAA